jgi:hypothetical protein
MDNDMKVWLAIACVHWPIYTLWLFREFFTHEERVAGYFPAGWSLVAGFVNAALWPLADLFWGITWAIRHWLS